MQSRRVLLIVPTLGARPGHLHDCLASISNQSVLVDIVVVAPKTPEVLQLTSKFSAQFVVDPGSQTQAINTGVAHAVSQQDYEFVNWLCDDDLLEPGSLQRTVSTLDAAPKATVAYGACRYIDDAGKQLWVSRAGPWATRILSWGPDLIPQPGMLIRMDAWQHVGGVDESYRFAFDLDLLLKLRKLGPLVDSGAIVSSFRWHAESLTVGDRTTNLIESERAKRASLSPRARKAAWLWEKPVRGATRLAAAEVNRRARKASS